MASLGPTDHSAAALVDCGGISAGRDLSSSTSTTMLSSTGGTSERTSVQFCVVQLALSKRDVATTVICNSLSWRSSHMLPLCFGSGGTYPADSNCRMWVVTVDARPRRTLTNQTN